MFINEDLKIELEEICSEDLIIYNYNPDKLKLIKKELIYLINNNQLSIDEIKIIQKALRVINDYLYIYNKVPFKVLNTYYLSLLNNSDLIKTRNFIIRIFNQNILMYKNTLLPLYSRTIDVCINCLIKIKNELEIRNINPYLTKFEISEMIENKTALENSFVVS